jgi:sugar phosphate isomerase/epimerase
VFRFAYNTNGLSHHRLLDALRLLHELGYEGVAITPDVGQLDPFHLKNGEVESVRSLARDLDLSLAVETGARFLLDPRRKHRPTLLEESPAERARRQDFLMRSIDLACELDARIVSIWSGASPDGVRADVDDETPSGGSERIWERLCAALDSLLRHADEKNVRLAFEPEPGMFVERPSGYLELLRRMDARTDGKRAKLGLCLDVGHLLVTGDLPVGRVIREMADHLLHVHLDDSAGGMHEHRMFGQGDLDLDEVVAALAAIDYTGLAAVELSRDAHRGAQAAEEAMAHLRTALARLP